MKGTGTALKLAVAVAAVWGGGCLPRDNPASPDAPLFSAKELAEFMGTREEREARAPYSPPGWPLRVGDTIPRNRWWEIIESFDFYRCDAPYIDESPRPSSYVRIRGAFWVGEMVFGAEFGRVPRDNTVIVGTDDFGDPHGSDFGLISEVPGGGEVVIHPRGGEMVYEGHFRRYVEPEYVGTCWSGEGSTLPPHIREHGFGVLAVPESDRDPAGTWTRERWIEGYVGGGR